jgi:hypothetical protein
MPTRQLAYRASYTPREVSARKSKQHAKPLLKKPAKPNNLSGSHGGH